MRVLVIEDNQKVARFLTRALSEEGYAVDGVAEGVAALGRLREIPYDLVVLDWMLPDVDGLSVCRQLRARGSSIPVLMLTARSEVSERIAGLDAGADDYLPKPFDLGEFLARVRALGRRRGAEGSLRVGPLLLDRAGRRVSLDGRRLDLTPREFALLSYLAQTAGRVVRRSELLAKVWDLSFDPGSNVVEVHIKNLRDKLSPHDTLIETVRGVGYQLKAEAHEAS